MEQNAVNVMPVRALPAQEAKKPLLREISSFMECLLCGGYLIDATSLIECKHQHAFCRSCIVQFLQTRMSCPTCGEIVTNQKEPCLSLRPDKILQKLIYKMVPGLYKNELERRKKHAKSSNVAINDDTVSPEWAGTLAAEFHYAPEDLVSVSLDYLEEKLVDPESKPINTNDVNHLSTSSDSLSDSETTLHATYSLYLLCPAAVKIADLYKLIKFKYDLRSNHEIQITCENVRLPNYLSLMDIAYLFSYRRVGPLRLGFQMSVRYKYWVPVAVQNKINDFVPPVKNSTQVKQSSPSDVNPTADLKTQNNVEGNASKSNMKRKPDSITKLVTASEKVDETIREPSVKIPRIETPNKLESEEREVEMKEVEADDSRTPESVPIKMEVDVQPPQNDVNSNEEKTTPKTPVVDNFVDYEQDIEEIVEDEDKEADDDEDDNRLRISHMSEDEAGDGKPDSSPEQLVIDTRVLDDVKVDKYDEDKKCKSKRKNKKSKHHHHRKHRHYERDETEATILSPDADTGPMKLRLKLRATSNDSKPHKQSKRKHKKSAETYSSCSSVCSVSPEPNSVSRADEDSLHSQISESSAESISETNTPKIELPRSSTIIPRSKPVGKKDTVDKSNSSVPPTNSKEKLVVMRNVRNKKEVVHSPAILPPLPNETTNEQKSPSTKEKLTQMRNFRPKNIAIVKPEEHIDEKVDLKNDNNNNDKPAAPILSAVEAGKGEVGSVTERRSPSSICSDVTVSKVTEDEMKKEQKKLQLFTGNKEESPALEIIVVPASKGLATVPSPTLSDSPAVTIRPSKPIQKSMKPIPAAIPLSQYQKMRSNEHQFTGTNNLPRLSEHNLPKSLTITPHVVTNVQKRQKLNGDVANRNSIADMNYDGIMRRVGIPFSLNDSALDLSGVPRPQVVQPQNKRTLTNGIQGVGMRMNGVHAHYAANLGINRVVNENGIRPMQKPEMHAPIRSNGAPYPVASVSMTSSSFSSTKNVKSSPTYPPTILRSQVPMRPNTMKMNNKVHTLPQLTEIKTGPPTKPGPNQNVRSIPTVNTILQRQHQPFLSNLSHPACDVNMMHRFMTLSNLKNVANSDKCPPGVPINKSFVDRNNVMVTK